MSLKEKKCVPCQGGIPPLIPDKVREFKTQISPGWELIENDSHLKIIYKFKDFAQSMELAARIGKMADEQWHHPELAVGYGHLDVEVWTHKIGGLVESDFIFCAKVDQIYRDYCNEIG